MARRPLPSLVLAFAAAAVLASTAWAAPSDPPAVKTTAQAAGHGPQAAPAPAKKIEPAPAADAHAAPAPKKAEAAVHVVDAAKKPDSSAPTGHGEVAGIHVGGLPRNTCGPSEEERQGRPEGHRSGSPPGRHSHHRRYEGSVREAGVEIPGQGRERRPRGARSARTRRARPVAANGGEAASQAAARLGRHAQGRQRDARLGRRVGAQADAEWRQARLARRRSRPPGFTLSSASIQRFHKTRRTAGRLHYGHWRWRWSDLPLR